MVKVEYLIETKHYKKGDIVVCNEEEANELEVAGRAKRYYENDAEIAKLYRDKHVLDVSDLRHTKDAETAEYMLGVSKENYNKIKGEPSKEFREASKIFSGKMELAKRFIDIQPLFFDYSNLWWIWNNELKCWEITDETTIANYLFISLNVNTINSTERNEIFQALKQVSRMCKPLELPSTYIQFKDWLVDVSTGDERPASHEYFTVNPIPHKLHENRFRETPAIDKIFTEWVGEKEVSKLYQIVAYCMLPDYPIHRIFCFIGGGMNGKSCFMRLIEKFIGSRNICSTELDTLLNSRFEITKLHKKLVCMLGETNFNELSKTSILKKLTGQDTIGFEYKNKTPFDDKNYAKILISTNNLPETTDKTIGFYRRWDIIDFPNQFTEVNDILKTIPEEEYECLAVKCIEILYDLLKERKFNNEGSIEDRQKKYEEKSNPLDKFLKEYVSDRDVNADIPKWEFEQRFNDWNKMNKFREMSDIVIAKKMKERGILEVKVYKEWFDKGSNGFVKRQVRCWGGIKWN